MHASGSSSLFTLLVLLASSAHRDGGFSQVSAIIASGTRSYCNCLRTAENVPWVKVRDFNITEKNDVCSTEIIVRVTSGLTGCVNPDKGLGQRLQKCWKRIKKRQKRKSQCLHNPSRKKG